MSGRVVTLPPWAVGPNYPPGPNTWNGTPVRVNNTGRLFTPGTIGGTQQINAILGEITDALAVVAAHGNRPALSWPFVAQAANGSVAMLGAAWDSKWGRWTIFGTRGVANAFTAYSSSDLGRTWFAQGAQQPSTGSFTSEVRGVVYAPAGSGIDGLCAVATYAGSGDVSAVVDETVRLSIAGSSGPPLAGVWFNGQFIFIGRDGSTPIIKTSTGGSWTTRTGAPSGWSNHLGFFAAASSTKVMAVASGLGFVTTDNHWILSSDGATWTSGTVPLSAGELIVGLAFAADRWAVAVTDGTSSRILTSVNDGAAWVVATTLTNYVLGGIGACGALLFAPATVHGSVRGLHSDDGGVTWSTGGAYAGGGGDRVFSSGDGFLTISANANTYSVSTPL